MNRCATFAVTVPRTPTEQAQITQRNSGVS
nr:MAG TPA: hypothetical protein [Caudoviricetes sp.]